MVDIMRQLYTLNMELIIQRTGKIYLVIKTIIDFINSNNRKSIPYNYIKNYGLEIKEGINPALDYIKVIDNYYFKEEV